MSTPVQRLLKQRKLHQDDLEKKMQRMMEDVQSKERGSRIQAKVDAADKILEKMVEITETLAEHPEEEEAKECCEWMAAFRQKIDENMDAARAYCKEAKQDASQSSAASVASKKTVKSSKSGSSVGTVLSLTPSQRAARLKLERNLLKQETAAKDAEIKLAEFDESIENDQYGITEEEEIPQLESQEEDKRRFWFQWALGKSTSPR